MAAPSNADSARDLTVGASHPPIPKDMQGLGNPIPLSPQWLLPKPGDNKLGVLSGDSHPHHGKHPDAAKVGRNGEDLHDSEKRKDVFRPSFSDPETGRRDRWRDEERETASGIRRDRWREADKELTDARRTERWTDNSSRQVGEARRVPSERWTESGNRETNYDQRRESKWNTRWGPDDKESDNKREKWSDSSRDGDISREKGISHSTNHGKDTANHVKDADKDGEHHSRSWRSNSFLTRGRGDSSHLPSLSTNKSAPMFGYGRGRGENGASVYSAGRGRGNQTLSSTHSGASRSYPLGSVPDKLDGARGDSFTLRYSRMKLLDIYRITDIANYRMSLDDLIEVPSLMLMEPLEPLALSAPTPEEMVILKGIDKGDVVSSGLPQASKDASGGRNSNDATPSKYSKPGSREDIFHALEDYSDGNMDSGKAIRLEGALKKGEAMGDASIPGKVMPDYSIPPRSSHDPNNVTEVGPGWSYLQEDLEKKQKSDTAIHSGCHQEGSLWQGKEEFHSEYGRASVLGRPSSEILGQEREGSPLYGLGDSLISKDKPIARKQQPHLSPEELSLYYKDPQGHIQGPFSGSDLIGWFEAGYFGIDLPVRLASAPSDGPFSLLGDIMPHLRLKSRPPPGFSIAKQSDVEGPNAGKFSNSSNIHGNTNEFELFRNGQNIIHGTSNEAENRYLESLMGGSISSSPKHIPCAEGVREYGGNASGGVLSGGPQGGSDMNFLLSQRLSLERQMSLPNPLPFWPGRDASSVTSNTDIFSTSPITNSKSVPPMGDARHIPQSAQNTDLLSMLPVPAEKSPPPAVNSGIPMWSNFPDVGSLNNKVHGGSGMVQDKMDMHHNQHFASQAGFGVPHQRLQPQNQPPLSHLINQLGGFPSGLLPPEGLLASEISQDPQIQTRLQQKLLLSQLQLQSQPVLPARLSPLDLYILQQQQQQQQHLQEQQQQQLLLQQQQQQHQNLLSQVLSGHQSLQNFGESSYGHLKAPLITGNAHIDQLGIHQIQEVLHINHQMPAVNAPDGLIGPSNLSLQVPFVVSCAENSSLSSLHLPHQMLGHPTHLPDWGSAPSQDIDNILKSDPLTASTVADSSLLPGAMNKSAELTFMQHSNALDMEDSTRCDELLSSSQTNDTLTVVISGDAKCPIEPSVTSDAVSSISEKIHDMNISLVGAPEQCHVEPPSTKAVKHGDIREVKKTSEKKTKKPKNTKIQAVSDLGKGPSKTVPCEQSKQASESRAVHARAAPAVGDESLGLDEHSASAATETLDSLQAQSSASTTVPTKRVETIEGRLQQEEVGNMAPNSQSNASHRAWKPASGLKPKSLLEIQMEEQSRAQTETVAAEPAAMVIAANIHPTPWLSGTANSENVFGRDSVHGSNITQTTDSRSRKSQLHDLLAEEVLAKANEGGKHVMPGDDKDLTLLPSTQLGPQLDITPDDDDFVEAKDTRKSRKKAAKAKSAGLKASSPVSTDFTSPPSEKGKTTRQPQQEPESLPVPPAGPSLADFVPWRGDQANPAPAPAAWSTETGKHQKPASLRDIQKEQGKKAPPMMQQIPIPSPSKVQPNQGNRGSGSSWQIPSLSPSKITSSVQSKTSVLMQSGSISSAHSKVRTEDDLFWGPLDQPKQEKKQSDFPSLANSSGWGLKSTTAKGVSVGAATPQKPSNSSRQADYLLSPPAATGQSQGREAASTKHLEAMGFRDWCENELFKLTGANGIFLTRRTFLYIISLLYPPRKGPSRHVFAPFTVLDTSFLEYCMKQTTAEADMLLSENLGSLDRNREFIDKFLNYKEFLSPDVIDIAFQARSSRKVTVGGHSGHASTGGGVTSGDADAEIEADGPSKGSGKKKGKKGKKVNPSVLGFNVVSNRIMMGEIQAVED